MVQKEKKCGNSSGRMTGLFFLHLLFFSCTNAQHKAVVPISGQSGTVVKIIDGDTFDVLTRDKNIYRIRMYGIDCPERKQDFYKVAKDVLANYIFKKEIKIISKGRDRNKRIIAIVYYDDKDINLAMIRNGYAWHYKKYSTDLAYAAAEKKARLEKKGLWQTRNPTAPWEFRNKKKNPQKIKDQNFFAVHFTNTR
ncbi:MAG: thermonuclease family protein [Chitinophagaceae bacterium]